MDVLGYVALSVAVLGAVLAAASPNFPDEGPEKYYGRKARQVAHRSRAGARWYRSLISAKYRQRRHKDDPA